MVKMLCLLLLSFCKFVYKVVDLFELVGLVIRMILCGCLIKWWKLLWLCVVIFKLCRLRCVVFLFSKCIIICLLCDEGMVEICILIVWLLICSEIWLFCGICFLVMLSLVIILICEMSSDESLWLGVSILCSMLLI